MNAVGESSARRFILGFLTGSARALIVWVVVLPGRPLLLSAQTLHYAKSPDVRNGEKVYKGGCIACHGSEGKGAPMASTVFRREETFPDFTDCAGTTPEPFPPTHNGEAVTNAPYHQNTTRLVTTGRHLSILIGTRFPAAEYKTARVDTRRHEADGLNPDL